MNGAEPKQKSRDIEAIRYIEPHHPQTFVSSLFISPILNLTVTNYQALFMLKEAFNLKKRPTWSRLKKKDKAVAQMLKEVCSRGGYDIFLVVAMRYETREEGDFLVRYACDSNDTELVLDYMKLYLEGIDTPTRATATTNFECYLFGCQQH